MKKLILFLLPFLSVDVFGQQKVYRPEKFEQDIMNVKRIRDVYKPYSVVQLKDGKEEAKDFEIETKKVIYDFNQFARSKNVKFEDFAFRPYRFIPIQILVQPDGSIDYFIYGFQSGLYGGGMRMANDSLNAEEQKVFVSIANEFCKNHKLPANEYNKKYSVNFNISLGKEPRKLSKKGISTLELAQNCDQPDTVKNLILNKLHLETFPDIIYRFKNLEKLDLSGNYIQQIPQEIWSLKKLKFLSLSENRIDYSSFKFKRNKHLKDLNLQYTEMAKMPKSLKKNRRLEILFVGNNPIKFVKNDFKRMTNLKALNLYNVRTSILPKSIGKLKNLEELDLYYNNLQFLPKEVCKLPKLKTLAVANNQLWNLPTEISKMPNLQTLYAHHNRLNTLPNLPNLKLLDIGYNLFKVFPEQVYQLKDLEEFDITHNEIVEIPEGLIALSKLQKIYIRGNEFNKTEISNVKLIKLTDSLEKRQVLVR
jgi:Leucine-rich repeat (LRR) protein